MALTPRTTNPKIHYTELFDKFEEYDKKHPRVWKLFQQFTFDRIALGFKHYSAKAIIERIRWETDTARHIRGEAFKLSNNHTAFYGRKFDAEFPRHKGFFRTSFQTSRITAVKSI